MNMEPWKDLQLKVNVDLEHVASFAETAVRCLMGDYERSRRRAMRSRRYKQRLIDFAADDASIDMVGVQDSLLMAFAEAVVDDVLKSGDW